ncbi:hypothetical protein V3C99_017260 [Haemonchus contortus]
MLASFLRLYPDQYPSSPGHRLPKEWASHHKMQRKFQWNTAICHVTHIALQQKNIEAVIEALEVTVDGRS